MDIWRKQMKIYKLWPETDYDYPGLITRKCEPALRAFAERVDACPHDPAVTDDWHVIPLYIDNPLLPTPDFFWWGRHVCCSRETLARFEPAALQDFKPVPVAIENVPAEYVLLHVSNYRDVTRDEEINRLFEQQGHYRTMHYLFKWECFERPQVFMSRTQEPSVIFCVSDCGDDAQDFYLEYKRLGLTGIQFRCVAERGEGE